MQTQITTPVQTGVLKGVCHVKDSTATLLVIFLPLFEVRRVVYLLVDFEKSQDAQDFEGNEAQGGVVEVHSTVELSTFLAGF